VGSLAFDEGDRWSGAISPKFKLLSGQAVEKPHTPPAQELFGAWP
jgi:hypothetical protein